MHEGPRDGAGWWPARNVHVAFLQRATGKNIFEGAGLECFPAPFCQDCRGEYDRRF